MDTKGTICKDVLPYALEGGKEGDKDRQSIKVTGSEIKVPKCTFSNSLFGHRLTQEFSVRNEQTIALLNRQHDPTKRSSPVVARPNMAQLSFGESDRGRLVHLFAEFALTFGRFRTLG